MKVNTNEYNYGKWEEPESSVTAFEAVRDGSWSLSRFDKWIQKVEVEVGIKNRVENQNIIKAKVLKIK